MGYRKVLGFIAKWYLIAATVQFMFGLAVGTAAAMGYIGELPF